MSSLLGHSSIQTTEQHYAPWDRRRRDRLTQVVRAANRLDSLLSELDPLGAGTGSGHVANGRECRLPGAASFWSSQFGAN